MAERPTRALLDTSVVVAPPEESALPPELAVSALTLAELVAGTHSVADATERAVRIERLQRVESEMEALPFDAAAARAYGRVFAAVAEAGRKPRGRRALDLMIAATALAEGLPLYTRNPQDFDALEGVLEIVRVG